MDSHSPLSLSAEALSVDAFEGFGDEVLQATSGGPFLPLTTSGGGDGGSDGGGGGGGGGGGEESTSDDLSSFTQNSSSPYLLFGDAQGEVELLSTLTSASYSSPSSPSTSVTSPSPSSPSSPSSLPTTPPPSKSKVLTPKSEPPRATLKRKRDLLPSKATPAPKARRTSTSSATSTTSTSTTPFVPPTRPAGALTKKWLTTLSVPQLEYLLGSTPSSTGGGSAVKKGSTAKLTEVEAAMVKKQLRLVKNRESAHSSRMRKKYYLAEIEKEVEELRVENARLKANVSTLSDENVQLRAKLLDIGGGSVLSAVSTAVFGDRKKARATAGVLMMAILFSFGLLFNTLSPSSLPMATMTTPPGGPARVIDLGSFEATSMNKDVLGMMKDQDIPTDRIRERIIKSRSLPPMDSYEAPQAQAQAHASQDQRQQHEQKETVGASGGDYTPDATLNMTTVFCPEVQSFKASPVASSANYGSVVGDIPEEILFLLPPTALGGVGAASLDSNMVMQLTCHVSDAQLKMLDLSDLSAPAN
eukprot:TRINITY_DN399_c0_g6_i2.p1 TRINITY_DN399_c0_g6~~TRINITY_DN399_c0_g6_i2.p1  ORF type:complete len:615 (+),score=236.44 TRINITY_DN399_c0_g6_i2:259-1845(+)